MADPEHQFSLLYSGDDPGSTTVVSGKDETERATFTGPDHRRRAHAYGRAVYSGWTKNGDPYRCQHIVTAQVAAA